MTEFDTHDFDHRQYVRHRSLEEFLASDFPENLAPYAPLVDWFVMENADITGVQDSYEATLVTVTLRDVDYHVGWSQSGCGLESTATLVAGSSLDPDVLEDMVRLELPLPLPEGLDVDVIDTGDEGTFVWLVRSFDDDQLMDDGFVDAGMREFSDIADAFHRDFDR